MKRITGEALVDGIEALIVKRLPELLAELPDDRSRQIAERKVLEWLQLVRANVREIVAQGPDVTNEALADCVAKVFGDV